MGTSLPELPVVPDVRSERGRYKEASKDARTPTNLQKLGCSHFHLGNEHLAIECPIDLTIETARDQARK